MEPLYLLCTIILFYTVSYVNILAIFYHLFFIRNCDKFYQYYVFFLMKIPRFQSFPMCKILYLIDHTYNS